MVGHARAKVERAWLQDRIEIRRVARGELARLEGAGRYVFLAVLDEAALDEQVGIWRAMIMVQDTGEHCPHHFRGRKR